MSMPIQCKLCPKGCVIRPGESGECRIRVNLDGTLRAVTYGYPSAVHVDPVEKKPLYHYRPGTGIFSIATVGCNLHCLNCQNWDLSQRNPEDAEAVHLPPERLPDLARQNGCGSIAYTYSDPVVFYEYTLDSCRQAHEADLGNVLVTAGYINEAPLRELCRWVDAANVDLKALSESFYRDICGATLQPVLHALVTMKSMGVMVEVTNLVIPGINDRDEDLQSLCRWIAANLGRETPLHFSRFSPHYKMQHLPPTPAGTLERARDIARAEGLHFVYVGNILLEDSGHTRCPSCAKLLIERIGFQVRQNKLKDGRCPDCRAEVYGKWA